jgi:hypothetical protein
LGLVLGWDVLCCVVRAQQSLRVPTRTTPSVIAGELGALLDKEFFAQDLPKFPPNGETASELISEAV